MIASQGNSPRSAAHVVFRAVGSTLAIAVVAFFITELRFGRFHLADFRILVIDYWKFFLVMFFALAIWDYWFWRTKRSRSAGNEERKD